MFKIAYVVNFLIGFFHATMKAFQTIPSSGHLLNINIRTGEKIFNWNFVTIYFKLQESVRHFCLCSRRKDIVLLSFSEKH